MKNYIKTNFNKETMVFRKNVLFFPGCYGRYKFKNINNNYEKILVDLGIEFVKLNDLIKCCGLEALNAGYRGEMLKLMESNLKVFKNQKISKIITNCPSCFRAFNEYYNIKVEHISTVIFNNLHNLKQKGFNDVTYFNPCELRKSGITDIPVKILEHIGYKVHPLKKDIACCGFGGGLKRNSPQVANRIAQILLSNVTTKTLITSDLKCYHHLKENAPEGLKVLEFSEVLV